MNFDPQPHYFYSPSELAALLKVSESTIRRLIREEEIQAITLGRQYRVSHVELYRLLRAAGLPHEALPPTPWQQLDVCFRR